jgi:WD40 repeat protein
LLATIHGSRVQITRDGQAIGPPLEHPSNVTAFTFSPDGLACATGTEDGTAYLWDCVRCKAAGKPLEHPGPVRGVTFSAKGRAFLAWSGSNHVRLWSTATGKPLLPPLMHPAEVGAAVFTPDGQAIAVASGRVVYLWDVATGKRLGPQLHHPDRVTHVVPSPDGSRLATACADRSVRFWDLVMPATGSVAENRAWVEALTGRELSDTGTIHEIDPATLQDLRRDLGMRGDEPFPRPTLRVLSPR